MKKNFVLCATAIVMAAALVFAGCNGKANAQTGGGSGGSAKAANSASKENPATDFKYDLTEDGTGVEIQEYIGVNGGKVVIPAEIEGYPVVSIGGFAEWTEATLEKRKAEADGSTPDLRFNKTSGRTERITSVVIPDTVTTIGDSAFEGCEGLKSVTLPKSLKTLGKRSFAYSGLTAVSIPEGTTIIGGGTDLFIRNTDGAFEGCKKLVSVTLPESLEEIRSCAFKSCPELTEVKLPSHALKYSSNDPESYYLRSKAGVFVADPDNYAFYGCPKLSLATRKAITDSGYGGTF